MKYTVKPSGKQHFVSRRAAGEQFVRSFVQHILPRGFQIVRYDGWMSQNCKVPLANVRWLVWLWKGWTYWLGSAMFQPKLRKRPVLACQRCGDEMVLMIITNQHGAPIWKRRSTRELSQRGFP